MIWQDCIDGKDESRQWPTCGRGVRERFVTNNETCQNVFICLWGRPGYVELKDLCDGIETFLIRIHFLWIYS